MAQIGYYAVDPDGHDHGTQMSRLEATTSRIIRTEVRGGSAQARWIELEAIVQFLHPGDELVVIRLEHVARSAKEVMQLVHELSSKGASLRVLEPEVTTSGDIGSTVITVIRMLADLENRAFKDRQKAGIAAGKAAGSYKGRLKSVDDEEILRRLAAGESKASISRAMNIHRMTIYRALENADGEISDVIDGVPAKNAEPHE